MARRERELETFDFLINALGKELTKMKAEIARTDRFLATFGAPRKRDKSRLKPRLGNSVMRRTNTPGLFVLTHNTKEGPPLVEICNQGIPFLVDRFSVRS